MAASNEETTAFGKQEVWPGFQTRYVQSRASRLTPVFRLSAVIGDGVLGSGDIRSAEQELHVQPEAQTRRRQISLDG